MICDRCRRTFPGNEAVHDTSYDRVGDGVSTLVRVTLCPNCAVGRGTTLMWYVYFFIAC